MDSGRFDALTRTFARQTSRRGLLAGIGALAARALGARAGLAQDDCPPGQSRTRKGECRCPPGTDACPDGCVDLRWDNAHCGACENVCPADATCRKGECRCPDGGCAPTFVPPAVCTAGNDPQNGSLWVVCRADASTAWVSHVDAAFDDSYHPIAICQGLGYAGYDLYGGTYGSVCGYDEAGTSCAAPGTEVYNGEDSCGELGGDELCSRVQWRCIRTL